MPTKSDSPSTSSSPTSLAVSPTASPTKRPTSAPTLYPFMSMTLASCCLTTCGDSHGNESIILKLFVLLKTPTKSPVIINPPALPTRNPTSHVSLLLVGSYSVFFILQMIILFSV
jgi:hypothetical protein